jgi:hypothetical protein
MKVLGCAMSLNGGMQVLKEVRVARQAAAVITVTARAALCDVERWKPRVIEVFKYVFSVAKCCEKE